MSDYVGATSNGNCTQNCALWELKMFWQLLWCIDFKLMSSWSFPLGICLFGCMFVSLFVIHLFARSQIFVLNFVGWYIHGKSHFIVLEPLTLSLDQHLLSPSPICHCKALFILRCTWKENYIRFSIRQNLIWETYSNYVHV